MARVFATVGSTFQQIGGECPDGWIEMDGPRPDVQSVAQSDGSWAPAPNESGTEYTRYPRFYGNQKLDLFTNEEQLAVVKATMNDHVVKLMYDRMLGAAYLTYEDPETEYGLQLLLDKGLITKGRKVAIVAAMQP